MEQAPNGVTVDLSGKLAERLAVALDLVAVDGAAKSVAAVTNDRRVLQRPSEVQVVCATPRR